MFVGGLDRPLAALDPVGQAFSPQAASGHGSPDSRRLSVLVSWAMVGRAVRRARSSSARSPHCRPASTDDRTDSGDIESRSGPVGVETLQPFHVGDPGVTISRVRGRRIAGGEAIPIVEPAFERRDGIDRPAQPTARPRSSRSRTPARRDPHGPRAGVAGEQDLARILVRLASIATRCRRWGSPNARHRRLDTPTGSPTPRAPRSGDASRGHDRA